MPMKRNPVEQCTGMATLTFVSGRGGFTMWAPEGQRESKPWWGTFGEMTPCLEGVAEPAVIEAVRLRARIAPSRHYFVVHTVRAQDILGTPKDQLLGNGSLEGRPELARPRLVGELKRGLVGFEVTRACTGNESNLRRPDSYEVLLAMRSGSAGVDVSGMDVDYRIGDREYTMSSHWAMQMCGERVDVEECSP